MHGAPKPIWQPWGYLPLKVTYGPLIYDEDAVDEEYVFHMDSVDDPNEDNGDDEADDEPNSDNENDDSEEEEVGD